MFEFILEFEPLFEFILVLIFVFDDIGVEVDIGVAFVMIAVFEFALRIFAFTLTFVSPHDVSANVPAATVNKYPAIFLISVSSKIYANHGRTLTLLSFDLTCR